MVHRRFVNAIQDNFDEEEKETPENRVNRWVRRSLESQRPDFSESSAMAKEDLGERDDTWMSHVSTGLRTSSLRLGLQIGWSK